MGVLALLFNLIQKLFGKSQELLFDLIGKRFALQAVGTSAIIGVIAASYAGVQALIAALTYAAPTELATAATWVVPSNFGLCATSVISAYTIKALMDYKLMIIQRQSDSGYIR